VLPLRTGCSAPWDETLSAETDLDEAVRAIGHPGRRAMLRVAHEERSASELAAAAGLSASAASPHLKLLRQVGLLQMRVDAKRRLYRVDFARMAQVRAALDELWGDRLEALKGRAQNSAERQPTRRRGSA
jgi:DNA-binding transcriptional ArsR family regulator